MIPKNKADMKTLLKSLELRLNTVMDGLHVLEDRGWLLMLEQTSTNTFELHQSDQCSDEHSLDLFEDMLDELRDHGVEFVTE